MPKKKPVQRDRWNHEYSKGWFKRGVLAYLPQARGLLLEGLDWNDSGVAGIVEEELDRQGVWKAAQQAMTSKATPHPTDALVDIHLHSSQQAFMLGVAYGLLVDRRLFEAKGGK